MRPEVHSVRLRSMPGVAAAFLAVVAGFLLLAFLRPSPWLLAGLAVAVLVPGRWWRWRTRRFRRGVRALEDGRPGDAREELEAFLADIEGDRLFRRAQPVFNLGRRYSYRSAALSNLGLADLRDGRVGRALSRFGEALAEEPVWAQAHYGRALALRSRGELADAEAAARRATEARRGYAAARALMAVIRRERGDEEGAAAAEAELREDGRDPGKLTAELRELWPGPV